MTNYRASDLTISLLLLGILLFAASPGRSLAEPTAGATAAFDNYIRAVQAQLTRQHQGPGSMLASPASALEVDARLRRGELIVERIEPPAEWSVPGAMLHHWRGTAFAPGARAADFERLMKDVAAYPQRFSPEVLQARALTQVGDRMGIAMRVRQRHVITVVLDATYDVSFERQDERRGYSISRSTKVSEIEDAGTPRERALSASEEHGFLWRQNTYWSYEERDGGLYMQIESVSMSRSIPRGLAWAVQPFVESVPRESLEFTLRSMLKGLGR